MKGIICCVLLISLHLTLIVFGVCRNSEWVQIGETCYLFRPDGSRSWFRSRVECMRAGGHTSDLASISSEAENKLVTALMTDLSTNPTPQNFWLVMSKDGPGEDYLWRDYTNGTYRNWGPGQPSDADGGYKNCVEVKFNVGTWKDNTCEWNQGYVCKMPST